MHRHGSGHQVLFTLGSRDGRATAYHRALARRLTHSRQRPGFIRPVREFGWQLAELIDAIDQGPDSHPVALVGSGEGAAVALAAAAMRPRAVATVIARGGEPERVEGLLREMIAPVLFVVDGSDAVRLAQVQECTARLRCAHMLERLRGPVERFEGVEQLRGAVRIGHRWLGRFLLGARLERAECA